MNLLAVAAAVLLGFWALETLIFVLGYRTAARGDGTRPFEPML